MHVVENGRCSGHSRGSPPLVLCNHVSTKGIFMGVINLLIWILENALSRKKSTLPNIEHPIGDYERKPKIFQVMLNYL